MFESHTKNKAMPASSEHTVADAAAQMRVHFYPCDCQSLRGAILNKANEFRKCVLYISCLLIILGPWAILNHSVKPTFITTPTPYKDSLAILLILLFLPLKRD